MPGRVADETESIPTPTEHGENMKRVRLTWTPLESEKIFRKCCFCYTWYSGTIVLITSKKIAIKLLNGLCLTSYEIQE